jgi:hypothetical protein
MYFLIHYELLQINLLRFSAVHPICYIGVKQSEPRIRREGWTTSPDLLHFKPAGKHTRMRTLPRMASPATLSLAITARRQREA